MDCGSFTNAPDIQVEKMAATNCDASALEENMRCHVCREVFQHKPFSLKCLHNYCEPCLSRLPREAHGGKEGISCPVCRQFSKNKDIQHNFMLEQIVQGFKHLYVNRILNKPPQDMCGHCRRPDTLTATCLTCDRELCDICKDTHAEIATGHEVVSNDSRQLEGPMAINVTKLCSLHPGQPIRAHCKPCQKAICGECKLGEHDEHATESVSQALQWLIPHVRDKLAAVHAKSGSVKAVCETVDKTTDRIVANHKNVLQMAEVEMERRIQRIKEEHRGLQDQVYTQTVVKIGMMVKQDLEYLATNMDSLIIWANTLLDVTQGPGTLYEIQNHLMLRINSLLADNPDLRDAKDFMGKESAALLKFVPARGDHLLGEFIQQNQVQPQAQRREFIPEMPKYRFPAEQLFEEKASKGGTKDVDTVKSIPAGRQLMSPKKAWDGESGGGQSGTTSWKLGKGEAKVAVRSKKGTGFVIRPTENEVRNKVIHVKYCCAADKYVRVTDNGSVVKGWKSMVYESKNIKKKIEYDWNMVYLAREEGTDRATVSWCFDLGDCEIREVEVEARSTRYENGQISWKMCAGKQSATIGKDGRRIKLKSLAGNTELTLSADLSKGKGDVAWQHTQLFRQPSHDTDNFPFEIIIYLK